MTEHSKLDRRQFMGTAAMTLAATQLGMTSLPQVTTFGPLKQIDAGLLNVSYAEAGPANGGPMILLHGWPYDVHSYVDVAPLLAAKNYRVLVPRSKPGPLCSCWIALP